MTRKELPAQAANLQRAIASTALCTPATVESLRSFLLPAKCPNSGSGKGSTKTAPLKRNTKPNPKANAGKPLKQPAITVIDVSAEEDNRIHAPERAVLATEIVNVTLRELSEAIRNPQTKKKRSSLKKTSSNGSFNNGTELRHHNPLQPLCVNRVSTISGEKGQSQCCSATDSTDGRLVGLRAQAECSRIAFATLRLMQGQRGCPAIPYLQLESGMSALIGRLITLGFEDLAVKELRILKRRLAAGPSPPMEPKATRAAPPLARKDRVESRDEGLVDMLKFSDISAQGQPLALITTTQLQVLKILAIKREPLLTKDALQYLQLEVACSPARMIQRQVEPESLVSRSKVAHQLESLAQSLIALCPNSSSAENVKASKSAHSLDPDSAFDFQLLALRTRIIWWKLAGHKVNVSTEMIEPFHRCLTAFNRRSTSDKKAKYTCAKAAFAIIMDDAQSIAKFEEKNLLAVYHVLADMSQEGAEYFEAIEWIKKSRKWVRYCQNSQIRLCILDCRLATLHIRLLDSKNGEDLFNILAVAASSLAGNLQGESAELDELLVNVTSLRRATFSMFQDAHRSSPPDCTSGSPTLIDKCSEIVLLCLRFVLRYVGNSSSQHVDEKTTARRYQRRRLAAQVSNPIIESVAAIARFSAKTTPIHWEELEVGLRDGHALAEINQSAYTEDQPSRDGEKKNSCPIVSISNAYWFRYLFLKQRPADIKYSKGCLRTSIDLIRDRPSSEQIEGLLPLKLEKYAELCEAMHDYRTATETYQDALHVHVNLGLLKTATEAAEARSIPHALDYKDELGPLSKVLLAYPKIAAKAIAEACEVKPFIDMEKLCKVERGILLELQLIPMLSMNHNRSIASRDSVALKILSKTLLSIYTHEGYPVRRLRVIVRLLAFMSCVPDALDEELQGHLQKPSCTLSKSHSDMGLLQFLPHLVASRGILANLAQPAFDTIKVEAIITLWSKMLYEHPNWDSLQTQVYDISEWLSLLELMVDYLDSQGLELIKASVLRITVAIHEAATMTQCSSLVSKLSSLGVQYARLGYSGVAGDVLHKAQKLLENAELPIETMVRWHLSYAEHALQAGNLKSCGDSLRKAERVLHDRIPNDESQKMKFIERGKFTLLIADACYVHALLAAAEGRSTEALYFSRLSVKSSQRWWALLEKKTSRSDKVGCTSLNLSMKDTTLTSLSELSTNDDPPTEDIKARKVAPSENANTVPFWSIVPRLFLNYVHLSHIFAYHGLLPEVKHYLAQAQKIADSVKASPFVGQYLSLRGQYLIYEGKLSEGLQSLQDAEIALRSDSRDRHYAELRLSLAKYHVRKGDWQSGESAFDEAEHTLHKLMTRSFLYQLLHQSPASDDLDLRFQALTLQEGKQRRQPQSEGSQALLKKQKTSKPTSENIATEPLSAEIPATDAIALDRLKSEVQRGRAFTAICKGSFNSAATFLKDKASLSWDQPATVRQALLASQIQFRQGIEGLVSDPIFCVLPESTIFCPSVQSSDERHQQPNEPPSSYNMTNAGRRGHQRMKGSAIKARRGSHSSSKAGINSFKLAQRELSDVHKLATTYGFTSTVHEITKMLGKVLIMLSATSSHISSRPFPPIFMVYVLEAGRLLSMARESEAIHVEQRLLQNKLTHGWPEMGLGKDERNIHTFQHPDYDTFQAAYIDIMPPTWTAISMTLSESREEILICKIRAGQSPLVLRLPLSRSNSLESGEEIFGFEEGKTELQDIIRLTNESTHGAQDLTQRGAKTVWWEARTALDARLKDLLVNIESIWLGGFKGIFSQGAHNQGLLARLHQSLQNILDKHLPSRQKTCRPNHSRRLDFDPRVIELFVGLGSPSEIYDIDEPLMDLLYFVVDILQFNGERNAYDEVDFDSIAIEMTDALRHYHQAVHEEAASKTEHHIILILDRHLHCFPWESLPCLSGHAVSRVPSMGCLRDRILRQRVRGGGPDSSPSARDKIFVNRTVGASILNPGGDLKATQEKFVEPLQELSGWETIVQQEPTESEMKTLLEDREIFLYFGHGSGSQYIRPRTIKKLDKCAVALLMGCSSGALTEAGDFESYGTPMNYMHAGSAAVLATLWDVTDKDIDRFSQTVLEEWGLFEKKAQPSVFDSPVKKSVKRKGKRKVDDTQEVKNGGGEGHVSLDEAVARGRDSCILKYLNGAAPVVYGVPVFLS